MTRLAGSSPFWPHLAFTQTQQQQPLPSADIDMQPSTFFPPETNSTRTSSISATNTSTSSTSMPSTSTSIASTLSTATSSSSTSHSSTTRTITSTTASSTSSTSANITGTGTSSISLNGTSIASISATSTLTSSTSTSMSISASSSSTSTPSLTRTTTSTTACCTSSTSANSTSTGTSSHNQHLKKQHFNVQHFNKQHKHVKHINKQLQHKQVKHNHFKHNQNHYQYNGTSTSSPSASSTSTGSKRIFASSKTADSWHLDSAAVEAFIFGMRSITTSTRLHKHSTHTQPTLGRANQPTRHKALRWWPTKHIAPWQLPPWHKAAIWTLVSTPKHSNSTEPAVDTHGIVHRARDRRWCMHSTQASTAFGSWNVIQTTQHLHPPCIRMNMMRWTIVAHHRRADERLLISVSPRNK